MASIDITGMPVEQVEAISKMALGGNLGFNIGPFLLASIFDCLGFGIVSQQYMTWFQYSQETERRPIRILTHVAALGSFAFTFHMIAFGMYHFVYHFGMYRVFIQVTWVQLFPAICWVIALPIQCFYAERSFRLNNRNWYILIVLFLLIAASAGSIIWLMISAQGLSSELQAAAVTSQVRLWQILTLSIDLVITSSIGYGLWRSRTGWSDTDALVRKLMMITLETQLGPTLLMLAFVIEFCITPPASIGIFFELLIPKAYVIGYLATLNSRYNLRREGRSANSQGQGGLQKPNTYALGGTQLQQATVHVDTETYTESYQMQTQRSGVNRGNGTGNGNDNDLYELKESESESVENLDYAQNLSIKNLHDPIP
ncbi:hypothetical protein IAT40_003700 [Kwoniella sp. CBS 6097]